MNILPIISRELRVASCRSGTYWARLVAAAVCLSVLNAVVMILGGAIALSLLIAALTAWRVGRVWRITAHYSARDGRGLVVLMGITLTIQFFIVLFAERGLNTILRERRFLQNTGIH